MIEIIADLRNIDPAIEESVADHPCRAELEGLLHRFAGQVIKIRVTVVKPVNYPPNKQKEEG